jgi:ribosomal protein S18 acetylase RimI-like enzyme
MQVTEIRKRNLDGGEKSSFVSAIERRLAMAGKFESLEGMETLTGSSWRDTMTVPKIKSATTTDEAALIAVITLAFSTDPAARWIYPDPHQYLTHFPPFVRAFGGKAFAHESAYYMDGYAGAALWLPPGVQPDKDTLGSLIQNTVSEWDRGDLFAVLEQMGSYHPKEPHWYLPLIGVEAIHQGHGYGSVLMEHALRPCDRDQTLAYLESSNPRNLSLYQRHGFEILGTIQVGTSPPLFPMLRRPR